jgi:RNA polymerase sigma factor (TIGR02999 family)
MSEVRNNAHGKPSTMTGVGNEQITGLLVNWSKGDERALEVLTPLLYQELRRMARRYMRRERPDHTLQGTALVHEAYMRLIDQRVAWKSRAHFVAIAAQMMRRILVDHAKKNKTAKRGAGIRPLTLDEPLLVSPEPAADLVALDDALVRLAQHDPQRSRIVELRFFGGLSNEESAAVLEISPATVQRQWAGARAWLYSELKSSKE